MNQREADAIAEVVVTLLHGPGHSWTSTLADRDLGPWTPAELARRDDLYLWLSTWILPALEAAVNRYGSQRAKDRIGAPLKCGRTVEARS